MSVNLPLQRLDDGAKKDQVLSSSFGLLRRRAVPAPRAVAAVADGASTEAMRVALAQKVKREEMLDAQWSG